MTLSKKSYWLEKSRDMYHVEKQPPVGKDRKKVTGPFPTRVPHTYTDLPFKKEVQLSRWSSKPKYKIGDEVNITITTIVEKQWKAVPVVGKIVKVERGKFQTTYKIELGPKYNNQNVWKDEYDIRPLQGDLFSTTAGKLKPKYQVDSRVSIPGWGPSRSGQIVSSTYVPAVQQWSYRVRLADGFIASAWEKHLQPIQGELFKSTAGKGKPKFRQNDQVVISIGGNDVLGTVRHVSHGLSKDFLNKVYVYRVGLPLGYDPPYVFRDEGDIKFPQGEMFMPTAATILPFRRKQQPQSHPGELTPEMNEDRDAVFYAYDNLLQEMKGIMTNLRAIGESELANNLQAAYHALTGEIL